MHDNQRQTSWAYVAGIMDADGCFMIMKNNNSCRMGGRKNPSYIPGLKIAMIEEEAIRFIVEDLGYGKYKLESARKGRPNSKPIFQWRIRSKTETAAFIEKILPYLKVKKKRAAFLLVYCRAVEDCPCPTKGLSEKELNYREESYWKMREFNGSKVAATTKFCGPERASDSLTS